MNEPSFLDLPPAGPQNADAILLPLPCELTVSYGRGTAAGPEAIWRASTQVELWDQSLEFDLAKLALHTASAITPGEGEPIESYLDRVFSQAAALHEFPGLLIGVGGEHSVTPALVRAAAGDDLSGVTVVQFDAHADLRDTYEGTPHSHACAMRRVAERGARVLAVGIRSLDREEAECASAAVRVQTYTARQVAAQPGGGRLREALRGLEGDVYLTIDIDVLEVHLCPGTGTPQPGGLSWWQTIELLEALLLENRRCRLIGCDLVETAPQPATQVNEFTAALLLAKIIALSANRK